VNVPAVWAWAETQSIIRHNAVVFRARGVRGFMVIRKYYIFWEDVKLI
jgi:hypothetical protein